MTIEEIGEHQLSGGKAVCFCVWFEVVAKQRVVKRDTFRPEVLKAVEDHPGPSVWQF
ncbi:MAG: hypothetical protein JNL41_09990 [Phenylobacterium sp.]|nr:hypothetical protein [Phenylobacterium sp.]